MLLHNRPENTSHLPNAGLMLVQRLALGRRVLFSGIWPGAHMSENTHQVNLNDVAPSMTTVKPWSNTGSTF